MATTKQKQAAQRNIKRAQEAWHNMTPQDRARRQPEGRARAKPGSTGQGDYFRVIVREKSQFTSFRNHDIGEKGHIQRLTGHRRSGSWATQAWLISKDDAHIAGRTLAGDTEAAESILSQLGSKPQRIKGDIFKAKPRRNVAEKDKPTSAQTRARKANIKKAQAARQSR